MRRASGAAEFAVSWFDLSTHHHTFASILRWCDTAQATLFPADADSVALRGHYLNVHFTNRLIREVAEQTPGRMPKAEE